MQLVLYLPAQNDLENLLHSANEPSRSCSVISFHLIFFFFRFVLFLLFYGYKFRVFAFLTHRKIIAKLCEPNFSLALVVVVVVFIVAAIWHALRVPNNICNYLFQFASIVAASKPASQSPTTAAKIVELCAMNNTKCLSISSPPPPSPCGALNVCSRASIKTCEKLLCAQDFCLFSSFFFLVVTLNFCCPSCM